MPRPPSIIPFVPKALTMEGGGVRPGGAPLRSLWDAYERAQLPRRSRSYQRTSRHVRHLSSSLSDHPSVDEVQRWCLGLHCGERTKKLYADHLQRLYSWGSMAGLCMGNPVAMAEFKKPTPEPRAIRDIGRAWPQILASMASDRERLFVGVLRFTGCRKQEALALRREDVIREGKGMDLAFHHQRDAASWQLRPLKAKEKSNRVLPVRAELRPLLIRVLGLPDPVVRVGRGGHDRQEVPFLMPFRAHELDRMRKALGLALPLHFPAGDAWHVLRHSLAYELRATAHADIGDIQRVLGHSSSRTTDAYLTGLLGRRIGKEVWRGL